MESNTQHLTSDHYANAAYGGSAQTNAFHIFARRQRHARVNEPKQRRMRATSESFGGLSSAKSRTVRLNLESQPPDGRRPFLPDRQREIRTRVRQFVAELDHDAHQLFCIRRVGSAGVHKRWLGLPRDSLPLHWRQLREQPVLVGECNAFTRHCVLEDFDEGVEFRNGDAVIGMD